MNVAKHENEQNFMTGVEFSAEQPYGNAVALFNLKFGCLEVKRLFKTKMLRIGM